MGTGNKRTGSVAELAVAAKLTSLDYNVSIPFGDTAYDIIAEKDGRLIRIQVKSATLSRHGSYRCCLTHGSQHKVRYTDKACDAIVLFAPYSEDYSDIPDNGFYVIPIDELMKRKAYHAVLFPSGRGRGNRRICIWEEYRDGWESL
tara:strand:- start:4099 stop:4536 length:438 start_codon:yes stop_codon:yes gene_type:complete